MSRPIILCVDDEPIVLESLKEQFRRQFDGRYQIEVAEDSAEALELIAELEREGRELPVIVSDHIMPGMKGDATGPRPRCTSRRSSSTRASRSSRALRRTSHGARTRATPSRTGRASTPRPLDTGECTEALERALQQTRVQHQQLVESQQKLVISDRLAVLGQLVAGVAHELNKPLGAIGASSDNLAASVASMTQSFWRVVADSTSDEQVSLAALVAAAAEGAPLISSRERRAARRTLVTDLEAHGILGPAQVADVLVDMGITAFAPIQRAVLESRARDELLGAASAFASLRAGIGNIQEGARRMSRIVFVLKNFANPGARDKVSEGSLATNLDNVLTLYGHQLRGGFEVVRDYSGSSVLDAMHDRLNQVWTNLVQNALQAMGTRGTLTLRVRSDGDEQLVVGVGDTGPGVPDEVKARIFEPFFTTKGAGEGSGLGLSICRDIVHAHGGTIRFESRPGETTFWVRLPRQAPRPAAA